MRGIFTSAVISMAMWPAANAATSETLELCKVQSEIAKTIMQARQSGRDMSRLMEMTSKEPEYQAMVLVAYDQPRFHTEEAIQREVQEFGNAAYSRCIKELSK